jgi:medium-chain acyl-[acyl-carrier-protein] hydrolase
VSATSKWILTDTERRRPVRLTEDIVEAYETDGSCQAMDEEIEKLDYDEEKVENALTTHYTVRRSDIDVNRHVHNINYIDIAYEAMPEDVFFDFIRGVYKNFHILYKKEIMYGDEVVCKYYEDDGRHVIVMFVEDKMHAIMQFS